MSTFVAHYSSANFSDARAKGFFDFESEARLGSKTNLHDARVRMLEIYGSDALSWNIDSVKHKSRVSSKNEADGQLELDFRDPIDKPIRKRRQSTKRGVL